MQATTINHLLSDAALRLSASGSPRLDAEILLSWVLGTDRAKLFMRNDEGVDNRRRALFSKLIERRAHGYPVAYLLERAEFWSLDLKVDEHVLIPRPETELVVETALGEIPENTVFRLADIGTGSGAIAIAVAKERPKCNIVATDICAAALSVAEQNIERHRCNNVSLVRSDWLSALDRPDFDVVLSNPPYVAAGDPLLAHSDIRFEPALALVGGSDGLAALRTIIGQAPHCLTRNGCLIIEHAHDQGDVVRRLMRGAGFDSPVSRRDLAGLERVTCARYR